MGGDSKTYMMLDKILLKLDNMGGDDGYYRARCEALERENAQLKAQLAESQENVKKAMGYFNELVDSHNSLVAQLREMKAEGMKITK